MIRYLIFTISLLWAAQSLAIPPDKIVYLKEGEGRFEPGPHGHWLAEPYEPNVLDAKAFDTSEVFLKGKAKGQTLLLLSNKSLGETLFWKVVVGADSGSRKEADTSRIEKTCKCQVDSKPVSCRVLDKKCMQALREWIQSSDVQADELRLVYSAQSLQEVLKSIDRTLAKAGLDGLTISFSGVNLRVEGALNDRAAWRKLMKIIYEGMIGKLLLEDKTNILDESERIKPLR